MNRHFPKEDTQCSVTIQENANQNYDEVSPHNCQYGYYKCLGKLMKNSILVPQKIKNRSRYMIQQFHF